MALNRGPADFSDPDYTFLERQPLCGVRQERGLHWGGPERLYREGLGMGGEVATVVGSGAVFALGLAMRLMSRRGRTGWGEILLELARGHAAATTERERRATTVEILNRLPHGGRVDEVDEKGRQRTYEVAPALARPRRKGGRR